MQIIRRSAVAAAAITLYAQSGAAQTTPAATCQTANSGTTYDYIIVGSGAAGIPLADRLTEAGKTVLLLEKGPPSSGRWGGSMKPKWLEGTNLTRFDVPGLCNQIWHDSVGVACTDTDQMEGCVLGGGTAVNAGLWWKPHPRDWDLNFPEGWKAKDMQAATDKVFSRIPGTWHPSQDGQLYLQQGFDMIAKGLNSSGWQYIVPNDHPDWKHRTYGHSTFMFSGGERGGPLATYLVSASQRKQFTLWTNTAATRVVRDGAHITGVELECNQGGYKGVVNVTPGTGRVILSAGTFASAKLLLRSGIGPADQLAVVRSSTDGPTMLANASWIGLPVGYGLTDHVGTDIEVAHPDVVFYDFYDAWNAPIPKDKDQYFASRAGILAQAAPNIGPMFWEILKGPDGIDRHLQWQSRVEGATNNSMTVTQYLGTGSQSKGRMTITRQLNTFVQTAPYLHNDYDKEAVIRGIDNIKAIFNTIANLTWISPPTNQTTADFVNSMPATAAKRRANHWLGTARIGTDDGRNGGSAVVDLDTKVYGTDNLFVVDGSIFPGQTTGNPSAAIVIAAEHAAVRILALKAPAAGKASRRWSLF